MARLNKQRLNKQNVKPADKKCEINLHQRNNKFRL